MLRVRVPRLATVSGGPGGVIAGAGSATGISSASASGASIRAAAGSAAGAATVSAVGGSTGGSALIPVNARIVYLGDSLIANAPMRSVRQLSPVLLNSRLQPGVGCNQGVGGERQDQILARVSQTTAQAPSLVVFCGGTNDIAQNRTLAQMQADHQGIVDALIAAGITRRVRWTIPRSTTITGPNETKRQDFNTWLRSRTDILLVDLETVYDPATSDSYDGTHPSWIGTRKIAAAEAVVIGPLLAAGTTLYADAADATAQGNLEANWDFAGTTGAKSGTVPPTGDVATGWTVTNNTACAVACSKTTVDGFAAQRIDITGSATAQNTIRLTNTIALSPNFQPGDFIDCAIQLSITATNGISAPTNLRGILVQAGSIANWGSNNPDASAGMVDIPLSGVFRTEPIGLSSVAASVSFEVTVQVPIGTADIRIVASRLKAVKSETVAHATPLAITSGKTAPRVTGTATVGSTLTAENQTWAGGAVAYTYQWQRGTTDISGATGRTYAVQAGDGGSTLRCVITGTNSFGSSAFTTADTATVPSTGSTGLSAGTATVSGSGSAIAAATGAATGQASAAGATGTGGSIASTSGASAGLATASGSGASLRAASGSAPGAATATGAGSAIAAATGSSAGSATVSGSTGAGGSIASTSGASAGLAIVSGAGGALHAASGSAPGTAIVSGSGSAIAGADLSGVTSLTFATTGTVITSAEISGATTLIFLPDAALSGGGAEIEGQATLTFSPSAVLLGDAPPDNNVIRGHFWEPHPKRRSRSDIDAEERRKLRRIIERAFADDETPEAATVVEIAAPVTAKSSAGHIKIDWDGIGVAIAELRKAAAAYTAMEAERRAREADEDEDEVMMLLLVA